MSNQQLIHVVLSNKKGLHARAAAKFVKTASQFDAKILVAKVTGVGVVQGSPPAESSGGSILGLMMLGAECGATLRLSASGTQAAEVVEEIKKLIESRFGED
jgi:phosphocarrier protein